MKQYKIQNDNIGIKHVNTLYALFYLHAVNKGIVMVIVTMVMIVSLSYGVGAKVLKRAHSNLYCNPPRHLCR